MSARYIVGIDLGTTHTVVAYAERAAPPSIAIFDIEQLVALGEVAPRPMLPSLRYHAAADELKEDDVRLPWPHHDPAGIPRAVIGSLARELGAQVPGRLVASAKSWLSHAAVDRTAPVLPWGAPEEIDKVSPVEASASYLAYLREAWDQRFADAPLAQQEVVLTVPASFDEAARALTVQAAAAAGLAEARLVEEPQAAFYDWLFRHRDDLNEALGDTRLALVCDVGGGTTDLTLIRIVPGAQMLLDRIGVGDHLMLGGDNMDLALAHVAEGRIGGGLGAARLSQLIQQCRTAKERLLATDAPEKATVTILGAGTRLIGGASSTELSRQEVEAMVVDGFFPLTPADEHPQRLRGGIVEFGLPYAADPAITRHVAAFLAHHAQAARQALGERAPPGDALPVPDALLLNGGVFHSSRLAERMCKVLGGWRGTPLRLLHNENPDAAVARGAVAYGLARAGTTPRIGGGSARNYFLVLEDRAGGRRGVCLLPRGAEEGHEVRLEERSFALRLAQPVRFDLVSSTADAACHPGELTDIAADGFSTLPPLAAVIPPGTGAADREIAVQLATELTEVGTLKMHCVAAHDPQQRWRLEFQLRGGPSVAQAAETELHPRFSDAVGCIDRIYGGRSKDVSPKEVKTLRNELEKILGPRDGWDTLLLRELFGALWERVRRRRRSADHERIWLNVTGYCLRPGFGYPLDDWRVEQLWRVYQQGIQFVNAAQVWSEWWTLWRRVAGGLEEAEQTRILDDIAYYLQPPGKATIKRPSGVKRLGYDDMVRLAASLERVPAERKIQIGAWLLERLQKPVENLHSWWAVGRLAAREPFYGSAHNVIPPGVAVDWLQPLLALDWNKVEPAPFAAALMARMTGDRERDLDQNARNLVIERLRAVKAPQSWQQMAQQRIELDETDERRMLGDTLPPGLKLIA